MTAKLEPAPGLWAFWRYDLCPYWVGGEITKVVDAERRVVEARPYGPGTHFRAGFICTADEGRRIHAKLTELRELHRQAQANLERTLRHACTRAVGHYALSEELERVMG